jgi:hypothetical protein
MKLVILLGALLALGYPTATYAQGWCAAQEVLAQQIKENPQLAKAMAAQERLTADFVKNFQQTGQKGATVVYTIPVVFHIVYKDSNSNISDARVMDQLAQMNLDFQLLNTDQSIIPTPFQSLKADFQIQFCLAKQDPDGNATTGIIRTSTTVDSFSQWTDNIKFDSLGGDDAWPRDQYLNIWTGFTIGKICWGTFPGGAAERDGIVMYPYWFGNTWTPSPHARHINSHEVGHWLNLRHIWGDDGDACTGTDFVDDTPNQDGPTPGCPSFPQYSCVPKRTTPSGAGDMFVNYMDYSHCVAMFSLGQKARAHATLATGAPRNIILSSAACEVTPAVCAAPWALKVTNITSSSAKISWANVLQSSGYTLSWKPVGATSWTGSVSVSAPPYTLSSLTAGTNYAYEVQVSCVNSSTYATAGTFRTKQVCSDAFESNNNANAAAAISANTPIVAQIGSSNDLDFFKFNNTTASPNIKVVLSEMPQPYTIIFYKPNKNTIIGSATGSATATSVNVAFNTNTIGTYYIRVSGGGQSTTSGCYNLEAQLSSASFYEADDEYAASEWLGEHSLFPNPASGQTSLHFVTAQEGLAELSLVDETGRLCQSMQLQAVAGANVQTIDTKSLASGIYFVRLRTQEGMQVLKLLVQK